MNTPTLPLGDDDLKKLLDGCRKYPGNGKRLRAMVLLLRYSGLRISDAVALRRERVQGDRIFLYQQKTGTPVYVPVPDFVIRALNSLPRREYLFWSGNGELKSAIEDWRRAFKSLAKIAGVKMCQSYARQYGLDAICVMPTNLYGSGDNFDLNNSHVIPALIRKFEEARLSSEETVTIWGSGEPRREFLYVDDLADACVYILGIPTERLQSVAPDTMLNIGVGEDLTIRELALIVGKAVGSNVRLQFDLSKPDGTPRKLLDVSRMRALGWQAKTQIADGLSATIDWFRTNR